MCVVLLTFKQVDKGNPARIIQLETTKACAGWASILKKCAVRMGEGASVVCMFIPCMSGACACSCACSCACDCVWSPTFSFTTTAHPLSLGAHPFRTHRTRGKSKNQIPFLPAFCFHPNL